MLAYLGLSGTRPLTREEVATAVWPDSEPEQARMSVRTALHAIRLSLGETAIQSDRTSIWIDQNEVKTDWSKFQRLVREAKSVHDIDQRCQLLQSAVDLVRAPMLHNLEAWWLAPHQLAFEELLGQSVADLVEALHLSGRTNEALRAGRSALTMAPLRQDIHISIIRVLNRAGRTDEAIRQFEALETLLEDHWGETPSQEAYDALNLRSNTIRTPDSKPHELRDSYGREIYGRSELVKSILARLVDPGNHRVLTLHGFGGIGKTTVAQAVLSQLPSEFEQRFIDLIPVRDPSIIPHRIAEAFGIKVQGLEDLGQQLIKLLADQKIVLLFDNAEHLAHELGQVLVYLLQQLPELRCLVTSRVLLTIPQELGVPVTLFDAPDSRTKLPDIVSNPCVEMFAARAVVANPDFILSSQNAQVIAEICHRLDGLPLAIELAAAQLTILSPTKLLLKLAESDFTLKKLVGATAGRHASLERVAAESYHLLDPEVQKAWRRLAVFRGSFDVDAAAVVADVDCIESILATLVSTSMLERITEQEDTRFRFLVPLRTFALESLVSVEEIDSARTRHRDACLAMANRIRPLLDTLKFPEVMIEYRRWEDDILQVVTLAIRDEVGLKETLIIVERLSQFFVFHGGLGLWEERIRELIARARPHVSSLALARGLAAQAIISIFHHSNWEEATVAAIEAHDLIEPLGNSTNTAFISNLTGLAFLFARHKNIFKFEEAEFWIEKSLKLIGNNPVCNPDDLWSAGVVRLAALSNLGWLRREQDRPEEAIQSLEQSMQEVERLGVIRVHPTLLLGLSDAYGRIGDAKQAQVYAKRSYELASSLKFDHAAKAALGKLIAHSLSLKRFSDAYSFALLFVETAELYLDARHSRAEQLAIFTLSDLMQGLNEDAKKCWALVLSLDPKQRTWAPPEPGLSYLRQIADVEPASPIDPDDPRVQANIDAALERLRLAADKTESPLMSPKGS